MADMRLAMANMTEMIWSFKAGLVAAGFSDEEALALTVAYQTELIRRLVWPS